MKKTNFDHYAEEYNAILRRQLSFFDGDNEYFSEYKVLKTKNLIHFYPQKILDFGCGIGRSSFFLKKHFPHSQIYGCDPSEKSLLSARDLVAEAHFFSMDEIQNIHLQFDLIFVAGVFHHVELDKREETLKMIMQLGCSETAIVVFEHNPFNFVTRYLVKTCPFDRDAVLLKPKELRALFLQAGMKNICSSYTLFFPGSLRWLRFLEKYLQCIPLGGQYVVSANL